MSELRLEELSAETASAANNLEIRPEQEQFAAPVTYTEEEPGIDPSKAWSRVVRKDQEVVGFIRAYFDPEHPMPELRSCIWRITVAGSAQGTGVGRFAAQAVIDEATKRGFDTLHVMWTPGEAGPGDFFHRLGFIDSGQTSYGDTIGTLSLS